MGGGSGFPMHNIAWTQHHDELCGPSPQAQGLLTKLKMGERNRSPILHPTPPLPDDSDERANGRAQTGTINHFTNLMLYNVWGFLPILLEPFV